MHNLRRFCLAFMAAVVMTMGLPSVISTSAAQAAVVSTPAQAAVPGSPITAARNGKCLDVDWPRINQDGAKVQLWTCNGSVQQKWYRSSDGTIHSGYNGKCLDIDVNHALYNGSVAQLWTCNGSYNQRWSVHYQKIRNGAYGKCLDADLNRINTNGAQVQSWTCNGSSQQNWYGIGESKLETRCTAGWGNDQALQTSHNSGRVRERMCLYYDRAVVWGVVQFQMDYPTSCSLGVGVPPTSSVSCPIAWYTKTHQLAIKRLEISGDFIIPARRQSTTSTCKGESTLYSHNTVTQGCRIGVGTYRPGRSYTVKAHDVSVDIHDDGQGFLTLLPASATFILP